MKKNSEIIRTEIIRILNENGKTRGTELAKRVIEKVGNEKMVYREISELVEAGEIENNMILVTRDTESGQACEENNLPYVLLDNDEIFKIVVDKLKKF